MAKEDKEYGVADMAKYLKKTEVATRALLRRNDIERDGKSYRWSTKGAMESAANKLNIAEDRPRKTATKAKKKVSVAKKKKKASSAASAEAA